MANNMYELIVSAKKYVQQQLDNGGMEHIDALAGADDQLHAKVLGLCIQRTKERGGINAAAALATVLACGEFCGWRRQFMMPSTKACCQAFAGVRKDISKGRAISLAYTSAYETPVFHRALGPGQRSWILQAARMNRA